MSIFFHIFPLLASPGCQYHLSCLPG